MAVGLDRVEAHDRALTAYAVQGLEKIPGLRLFGSSDARLGVVSFVIDGVASADVGAALDRDGIAVRVGHHCALPALQAFGVETIVRLSLAAYNTTEDLDAVIASLRNVTKGAHLRSELS
jgi:cysteine desulfurase/selenocysteine lyase